MEQTSLPDVPIVPARRKKRRRFASRNQPPSEAAVDKFKEHAFLSLFPSTLPNCVDSFRCDRYYIVTTTCLSIVGTVQEHVNMFHLTKRDRGIWGLMIMA